VSLEAGRAVANRFWREQVRTKQRKRWQMDQWMGAMHWFLHWLEICAARGFEVRSLAERLKGAIESAGARRGLAPRTRATYASWVVRYGQWAGSARKAMDPAAGRDFLTYQVEKRKVSFATQKQALCALVFFFKDVCGMEEVDLEVKLHKTPPRIPVVLRLEEVLALVDKLTETWKLAALLQYAAGLRRSEVMSLRIKDVDLVRRTITVRQGKGDKDCLVWRDLQSGFAFDCAA